jgi:hypothetical protein
MHVAALIMTDKQFQIDKFVFDRLLDRTYHSKFVEIFYSYMVDGTGITIEICPSRLSFAHHFWQKDLVRVSKREFDGGELDHFKQSGHLSYWLRRQSPVIRWDISGSNHEEYANFLVTCGNEHFSFMLGYRLCLYFECNKDIPFNESKFALSSKYVRDTCYFLKQKNVSPHALALIFRSIFERSRPF